MGGGEIHTHSQTWTINSDTHHFHFVHLPVEESETIGLVEQELWLCGELLYAKKMSIVRCPFFFKKKISKMVSL